MSRRKSVYISRIIYAESHATVQAITAEIRLFYPPGRDAAARQELTNAYREAFDKITSRMSDSAPI